MIGFIEFARASGVDIQSLNADGRIHRVGTTLHPRSKNGAYMFDGVRGWAQAWDGDTSVNYYGEKIEFTQADKAEWVKKKQAQEAHQEKVYAQAANKAQEILSNCELKTHEYLAYQKLDEELGFVTAENALIVPMYSLGGKLQTIQQIKFNDTLKKFEKKMLYGGKAKLAIHRLGNKNALETILCEGYATGLSIKLACDMARLNVAVVVCFSANNLVDVAKLIKGKIMVFADNDASLTGETSAVKTGLAYCMSDVIGDDANDLHRKSGLIAVLKKVMEVRAKK